MSTMLSSISNQADEELFLIHLFRTVILNNYLLVNAFHLMLGNKIVHSRRIYKSDMCEA